MPKRIVYIAAAIFLAAFFAPTIAADTVIVHLRGTITDLAGNGINGASVSIPEVNLTATTPYDAATPGSYYIDALAPLAVTTPLAESRIVSKPMLCSDGLRFSVGPSSQFVKIDVFTLQGRCVRTLGNVHMAAGSYRVNPFLGLSVSQTYLMSVKIGDQTTHLKAPVANGRTTIDGAFRRTERISTATPSPKKSAVVGNLNVTASGFSPVSYPLDSFQGTHWIKMKTPAQASKKLLTVKFTMDQDPNDAIDQVLAIWVEDMTAKHIRTLYVTPWLATTGYDNPIRACGSWLDAVDTVQWGQLVATNRPAVDAVSMATPEWGKSSLDCNPDSIATQSGNYRMCIEAHISGAYNLLYVDTLALGGADNSSVSVLKRIPSQDPNATIDGLNGVSFSYR